MALRGHGNEPTVQVVTIQRTAPDDGCCYPASEYPSYKANSSRVLGAIQITLGLVCMILQIVGMVVQDHRPKRNALYDVGASFWCCSFFILSGALAVAAAYKKSAGLVICSLVFSIISALMAFVYMSFSAATVAEDNDLATTYFNNGFLGLFSQSSTTSVNNRTSVDKASYAMCVLMLIFSFVGIITSIWVSGLGCAATCCGPQPGRQIHNRATVIPAVPYTMNQHTTYIGPQGGGVVMVGDSMYGRQQVYSAQIQQPPAYYPNSAPPTYVAQDGPAEVHMPYPTAVSSSAPPLHAESK